MTKQFDGHDYTEESVLEALSLIELHARDGSAINAGCSCIEEKHLLTLAGLASEMPTLTEDQDEKEYYLKLADTARNLRKDILEGKFKAKREQHSLSKCEKKMQSCIEKAEIKCCGGHTEEYSGCSCNPVDVCAASVHCTG